MSFDPTLYLVTDAGLAARAGHDVVDLAERAVRGGVTAVQVREKDADAAVFLDRVIQLSTRLPDAVALLVNDRVDVFLAARAKGARVTGVHVGQSDLPAEAVRALIGDDAVLGLSASTAQELRDAAASPARVDYVGIGAVHATATKTNAPPPLGLAAFARAASLSDLPAVAIGGITIADLPGLRAAGAAGAAVVSAICAAEDPEAAARALRDAWGGQA